MSTAPMGLPASRAELLRMRYQSRLPRSLEDLIGPVHGTVQLPLHIAWSGMTAFDLDRPKHCAMMYHIVLTEGQLDDLPIYINHRLLVSNWPILRELLGHIIREVWESALPVLHDSQADNV